MDLKKLCMNEPDLRFVHGKFKPSISQAVQKPCPRGGVPVSPFPQKMNGACVKKKMMPRDIMSSEQRHWMVFGQLSMAVQCCAEA